jgi:hypothetical protein
MRAQNGRRPGADGRSPARWRSTVRADVARLAVVLTLFALLVPAGAALAQDNPFAPLPAATPTPAPAPAPTATVSTSNGLGDTGSQTLFLIAGALLVFFVAIGFWIARDARRSVPEHRRGRHMIAEPAPGEPRERRRDPKAKARARQRARAQRQARKQNRPR